MPANQAVNHLRQQRREKSQQHHNAVCRFDGQRNICASICLLQAYLNRTTNAVCDVSVWLLTQEYDNSIAVNLIPFVDYSYEFQFTFRNLRTEFSPEGLERDQPAFMFTTEIIKKLRPFVFRNLSGLHGSILPSSVVRVFA